MKKVLIKNNGIIASVSLDNLLDNNKFIPVYNVNELPNDKVEIITGTIDKKLNVIIPFRKSVVLLSDFLEEKYENHINYFDNDKAIYQETDNRFYVIDLNNVIFDFINNKFIPSNFIKQIYSYYIIDNKNIIEYSLNNATIYDVSNDKYNSLTYDFIKDNNKFLNGFDAFYIYYGNKYSNPIIIQLLIDKANNISNKVIINDVFEVYLNNEIIKDGNLIKKYCDSCYNDYYENVISKSIKKSLIS